MQKVLQHSELFEFQKKSNWSLNISRVLLVNGRPKHETDSTMGAEGSILRWNECADDE